jgi:predicted DsbA family dithiol-disulfide isomerase
VKEVNRTEGEGAPLWEQEAAVHTRTGLAFLAGQAAARQGGDAADRFRFLLQAAFHTQHLDIREPGVLEDLAREARLDVARFEGDRRDTRLLPEVGRSHRDAVAS